MGNELYSIDFTDTQALWSFSLETLKIARDYQEARERYANALKLLKTSLAKAYSEGKIKESASEDKAYLFLTNDKPELLPVLEDLITNQQLYKAADLPEKWYRRK